MRDVCARTGLARSTIHHYIREGLLPRPTKTGRNTAVYDEEFVRRVRLIRTLQERAHLPLAQIRETLHGMPDAALETIDLDLFQTITRTIADTLRMASERPVPRRELLAATGLKPGELDGLRAVGLIEPSGGEPHYSALDARIALAYARIRAAGVTAQVGSEQVVAAYHRHLTALARAEAREMVRHLRTLSSIDVGAFIQRTAEPLGELVAALHQKALVAEIGNLLGNGTQEG